MIESTQDTRINNTHFNVKTLTSFKYFKNFYGLTKSSSTRWYHQTLVSICWCMLKCQWIYRGYFFKPQISRIMLLFFFLRTSGGTECHNLKHFILYFLDDLKLYILLLCILIIISLEIKLFDFIGIYIFNKTSK